MGRKLAHPSTAPHNEKRQAPQAAHWPTVADMAKIPPARTAQPTCHRDGARAPPVRPTLEDSKARHVGAALQLDAAQSEAQRAAARAWQHRRRCWRRPFRRRVWLRLLRQGGDQRVGTERQVIQRAAAPTHQYTPTCSSCPPAEKRRETRRQLPRVTRSASGNISLLMSAACFWWLCSHTE